MRTRIFRILAGLLAVLFVCVLTLGDRSRFSWGELAGFIVITVLFSLFAVLGPHGADWWLALWFGSPANSHPTKPVNDTGEQRQEEQWPTKGEREAHGPRGE
jgi:hypothetical protein